MPKVISLVPDPGADTPALRDIPLMLRRLADQIEEGEKYGPAEDVRRATIVLRINDRVPAVLGFGDTDATQSFEDLHAGALELIYMTRPERA